MKDLQVGEYIVVLIFIAVAGGVLLHLIKQKLDRPKLVVEQNAWGGTKATSDAYEIICHNRRAVGIEVSGFGFELNTGGGWETRLPPEPIQIDDRELESNTLPYLVDGFASGRWFVATKEIGDWLEKKTKPGMRFWMRPYVVANGKKTPGGMFPIRREPQEGK